MHFQKLKKEEMQKRYIKKRNKQFYCGYSTSFRYDPMFLFIDYEKEVNKKININKKLLLSIFLSQKNFIFSPGHP